MADHITKTDASVEEKNVNGTVDQASFHKIEGREQDEVFQASGEDGVNFRTVSWPKATIIFLKIQFAMSILAVPGAVATLVRETFFQDPSPLILTHCPGCCRGRTVHRSMGCLELLYVANPQPRLSLSCS